MAGDVGGGLGLRDESCDGRCSLLLSLLRAGDPLFYLIIFLNSLEHRENSIGVWLSALFIHCRNDYLLFANEISLYVIPGRSSSDFLEWPVLMETTIRFGCCVTHLTASSSSPSIWSLKNNIPFFVFFSDVFLKCSWTTCCWEIIVYIIREQ